jgi:hypothetical protein
LPLEDAGGATAGSNGGRANYLGLRIGKQPVMSVSDTQAVRSSLNSCCRSADTPTTSPEAPSWSATTYA